MEFFDTLKNFFEKTEDISSSTEHSNYYMIIKWLSMHPPNLINAIKANELAVKLPYWATGCLLDNLIKKVNRAPRINYLKVKKENEHLDKEIIDRLANYLCCSRKHAAQAFLILRDGGVNVYGKFGLKEKKK